MITFYSCGKGDSNPNDPGNGGDNDTIELFYDDSIPSGFYYETNNEMGPGVQFTLPGLADSYQIIGLKMRLGTTNAGNISFSFRLFTWENNQPDSLLTEISVNYGIEDTWNTWDISSENLIMEGNDRFMAGMICDGVNQPSYGFDNYDNYHSWYYDGLQWTAFNQTIFMRALILDPAHHELIELQPVPNY
ncbi:MAG: hypothetical protein APR63_00845 [Desulfuromonas sp. SDB]|nr:MAG: hypothetical protein APR63_00845 [Desulfuromonas sp. SDB]